MEPENYDCYEKCDKRPCKCLSLILSILFTAVIGVIGLILGAVFATALIANLAVLIATAVILAFLFILTIIYKICECKKRKCK